MARINPHFLKLASGYLFPEIARRAQVFQEQHPEADLIRLGVGDVVLPLVESVREAMHRAVDDMGREGQFKGYGPYEGYDFLREAIAEHDYRARGIAIAPDEVFVTDGSKGDCGNIQELFSLDARIAVTDPTYPVYVDTNVMAGRTGPAAEDGTYEGILYLPCVAANDFVPEPPETAVDLVYLCFPNNPTGAVASAEALSGWVRYAKDSGAILLFDGAYEAFITDPGLPHSIYEVPGAREVAIEFRSFSKMAGFTGVRCGYVIVPKELSGVDSNGTQVALHDMWMRRQSTRFNGTPYPVQVAAAACYTESGRTEIGKNVDYYMQNARTIRAGLTSAGLTVHGAINAPYAWVETPEGQGSWEFFDRLLEDAWVVSTPGAGFGASGEGYLRLSAFGKHEQIDEAIARIAKQLGR